jgi:putative transposase
MVQREGCQLSIRQQCRALSLHRSNLYYEPQPVSPENLALMRVIDATYLKHPELGRRGMTLSLRRQGHAVNVKRVRRLMQLMGLESLAPKPNLSRSHPEHKKYPYLLKGIEVTRANQVWATDISYIPLAFGFLYVVAIIDWFSRAVLTWRLSNTLDTSFCTEALQEALDQWGKPDIFNSDQGVQFTSEEFTAILKAKGIQISMDGKGRCLDNVFVERLWRSLKYEEVYLHAYEGPREARRGIGGYLDYFNNDRPHQALAGKTPMEVYLESITLQTKRAA